MWNDLETVEIEAPAASATSWMVAARLEAPPTDHMVKRFAEIVNRKHGCSGGLGCAGERQLRQVREGGELGARRGRDFRPNFAVPATDWGVCLE
jgi:hypothetical protein